MAAKDKSNIDLQTFFNTQGITQTKIISDYEGEQIPDLGKENLLICGDIIDSTVGGGGDSTQIPVDGSVGGISKNFNLYNIHQVLTKSNIRLILGNRDFNKIKCLPLCKMKYTMTDKKKEEKKDKKDDDKSNIEKFNNGNLNLSQDTYIKYQNLIKENDWIANMNNWLPFWNQTVFEIEKNYKTWHDPYVVKDSNTPFLDRFNKIFGPDGSVGTMSAGNLLYTIPFEVLGVKGVTEENKKNTDYLAFIVLSVFNAGFNKINILEKYDKPHTIILPQEILHNTYINGLLYKFYRAIGGEKVNFMGYANLNNKLYLFSHGGITSDLINNPDIKDLQTQIKTDYEKITNSEKKSQQGGAIDVVTHNFTREKIILSLNLYNDNVCKIVKQFMDDFYKCMTDINTNKSDLSNYTYMPSHDMLLLLCLSASYRPGDKDMFDMRSPINPGIVKILVSKKGFVCDDAVLTQIFGHIPKGFGPTFFTLQNGDKKSYLANIDMSQSFKYSGWAGKSKVTIGFNKNTNNFTLYYILDFSNEKKIKKSDKTELTQIYTKDQQTEKINTDDDGKYILINTTIEPSDKTLTISQSLDEIFKNEEKLKTELTNTIGKNVILYHGFDSSKKLHIFSLSDSMTSHNKVLVLYTPIESQAGGYYEKYMKYKTKYIALKNSMSKN